jgi:hypothetical protein
MSANTKSPYKYMITLDEGAPEPQGVPIPTRETAVEAVEIAAGMACRTSHGHIVRVVKVHMGSKTPYALVYGLKDPRQTGPLFLDELTPVARPVIIGDTVRLHIGARAFPVDATVVDVEGDYACFELPEWGEAHWGHTAHILSVKPRSAAR